jgi:hypothetical protein
VVYIPFSQMKENEEEQRNINTLFVAGKWINKKSYLGMNIFLFKYKKWVVNKNFIIKGKKNFHIENILDDSEKT